MDVSPKRGRTTTGDARRERVEVPPSWAEVEETLDGLLDVVARVAARDFSVKPALQEGEGILARFQMAFRFMIEDLERALGEVELERKQLQKANAQLKELDLLKTRFINTAAHELGTPLTPVRIQLYLLEQKARKAMGPSEQRAFDVVRRNFERFSEMVHDMLEVSRIEAKQVRLAKESTNLSRLVERAVDTFAAAAETAGVVLQREVAQDVVTRVDGVRVEQIVYNLISNALRHTPSGKRVTVELAVEGAWLNIRVRDEGVGLEPAELEGLFKPFSQPLRAPTDKDTGTGLGLYISRGLAEAHGGSLAGDSSGRGQGAEFTLRLPFEDSALTSA